MAKKPSAGCCKNQKNHTIYQGVKGPVTCCKKCGRTGRAVTEATAS